MNRSWLVFPVACSLLLSLSCSSTSSTSDAKADEDILVDVAGDVLWDVAQPDGESDGPPLDLLEDETALPDGGLEILPDAPDGDLPAEDVQIDTLVPFPDAGDTVGVVMELENTDPLTPFPWNWYLVEDPTSRTGVRMNFDLPSARCRLLAGFFDFFETYRGDMEKLDGFGSLGFLMIPVSTDMNLDTLPVDTRPGSPIQVVRIDDAGIEAAILDLTYETYKNQSGEVVFRVIQLLPRVPLREKSRYLAVVKKSLEDAEGNSFEPFPLSEVLLGLREPFGPTWMRERLAVEAAEIQDALAKAGMDTEEIAAAWTFDVGPMEEDLFRARDHLDQADTVWNLDPDGDGTPNIWTPAEYSGVPDSDTNVKWIVEGEFQVVNFRNEEGIIVPDSNGDIAPTGTYWRPFWLMIPAAAEEGTVPILAVQHGLDSSKESMLSWGRYYASQGMASACFAFLHHEHGAGGGFKFIKIDYLLETRDNFRQAALEYYQFVRTLKAMNVDEDFVLEGTPDFDFSRFAFTGHSLGAMESTMTAALYREPAIAGLVNGGGNIQYIIEGFLKSGGLYDLAPGNVLVGFKAAGGQVLSAMDPAVFARYLMSEVPEDSTPIPYLLVISTEDETVYPECGYALGMGLGSSLLEPCINCWEFMPKITPADAQWGTIQMEGGHATFMGSGGLAPQVRQIYYDYITGFIKNGTLEIKWPPD